MALGKQKEKKGQTYLPCSVTGCNESGRVLARLGDIEIAYCAHHRKKYGERVINALINAKFNYKLSRFLSATKKEFFMNHDSHLCPVCRQKEAEYISSKIEELKQLQQEYEQVELETANDNPDVILNKIEVE